MLLCGLSVASIPTISTTSLDETFMGISASIVSSTTIFCGWNLCMFVFFYWVWEPLKTFFTVKFKHLLIWKFLKTSISTEFGISRNLFLLSLKNSKILTVWKDIFHTVFALNYFLLETSALTSMIQQFGVWLAIQYLFSTI